MKKNINNEKKDNLLHLIELFRKFQSMSFKQQNLFIKKLESEVYKL